MSRASFNRGSVYSLGRKAVSLSTVRWKRRAFHGLHRPGSYSPPHPTSHTLTSPHPPTLQPPNLPAGLPAEVPTVQQSICSSLSGRTCTFPTQAESMKETLFGHVMVTQAPHSQARLTSPRSRSISKKAQSRRGSGFETKLMCNEPLPSPPWGPAASWRSEVDLVAGEQASGDTFSSGTL